MFLLCVNNVAQESVLVFSMRQICLQLSQNTTLPTTTELHEPTVHSLPKMQQQSSYTQIRTMISPASHTSQSPGPATEDMSMRTWEDRYPINATSSLAKYSRHIQEAHSCRTIRLPTGTIFPCPTPRQSERHNPHGVNPEALA